MQYPQKQSSKQNPHARKAWRVSDVQAARLGCA
jgi:hypothetical protein